MFWYAFVLSINAYERALFRSNGLQHLENISKSLLPLADEKKFAPHRLGPLPPVALVAPPQAV